MKTTLKHPLTTAVFEGFMQGLFAARDAGELSNHAMLAIVNTAAETTKSWLLGNAVVQIGETDAVKLDALTENDDNFEELVQQFGLTRGTEAEEQGPQLNA